MIIKLKICQKNEKWIYPSLATRLREKSGDRMRATTFLIISSLHTTLVTPVLLLMDRK